MAATRAVSFLEASLPTQAFYENRRSGIDWAFERDRYLVNAGYFFESDLLGNNKGDTAEMARSKFTLHHFIKMTEVEFDQRCFRIHFTAFRIKNRIALNFFQ